MNEKTTHRKHLVGLVEDEHLHRVGLQVATLDHVLDTSGGANNDLGSIGESLLIVTDAGTSDTGVALDVHKVTDGDDDLLDLLGQLASGSENQSLALLDVGIDLLENGDREGGSLAGTRLSLRDDVVT